MVSVLIQENSSWMKEGEGERRLESLSRRGKHAVIIGDIIQKNRERENEQEKGRRRKGYKDRFIATASFTSVY